MCYKTCSNYKKWANSPLEIKSDFKSTTLALHVDWCSAHKPNRDCFRGPWSHHQFSFGCAPTDPVHPLDTPWGPKLAMD